MALKNKNKTAQKKILPFVTQYHPALPNKRNTHGEVALDTEPTTTKKYLQGATPPSISQRKILKRHPLSELSFKGYIIFTCEVQESCRPVNIC